MTISSELSVLHTKTLPKKLSLLFSNVSVVQTCTKDHTTLQCVAHDVREATMSALVHADTQPAKHSAMPQWAQPGASLTA